MIREDGKQEVLRPAPKPAPKPVKAPAWLGKGGAGGSVPRNDPFYNPAADEQPWANMGAINPTASQTALRIPNASTARAGNPFYNPAAHQQPWANMGAINPQANQLPWANFGMENQTANRPFYYPPVVGPSIPAWMKKDDGNVYNPNEQGITEQGTPTMGVNSFIGGGGEAVRSPLNDVNQALWPWMPAGVNSFIGGGGEAMRYAEPAEPGLAPGATPTGNGFGTRYNGWGGGGGGGYGGGYGYDGIPAWLMNLYSWDYKG